MRFVRNVAVRTLALFTWKGIVIVRSIVLTGDLSIFTEIAAGVPLDGSSFRWIHRKLSALRTSVLLVMMQAQARLNDGREDHRELAR